MLGRTDLLTVLALGELRFEHVLPGLELRHPVHDCSRGRAVEQRLDEAVVGAVDLPSSALAPWQGASCSWMTALM
jgi:hypothetical protein